MRRRADLCGLPVVEIDSGRTLGQIADTVFDLDRGRLEGFIVEGAAGRVYLSFDQVYNIGANAVTVGAEAYLHPAAASPGSAPGATGTDDCPPAGRRAPLGLRVVTRGGQLAGLIDDIIFDPESGTVWGYQVTTGLLSDLVDGKKAVPLTDELVIGPDSVIVPDGGLLGAWEAEGGTKA